MPLWTARWLALPLLVKEVASLDYDEVSRMSLPDSRRQLKDAAAWNRDVTLYADFAPSHPLCTS